MLSLDISIDIDAICKLCFLPAKWYYYYRDLNHITWNYPTVVATTCQNSTHSMLTSAKLSVGYLVVGITRELDKVPLLYCSSIILQAPGPCYNNNYLPLCPYIVLMFYYSSTCVFLKATMLPTYALMSYS